MHRMMKRTMALIIVGFLGCSEAPPAGRHYEKSGGFSYDPPEGWTIVEFPGLKYRISHGPSENDFAPNINIIDESFAGSLDVYVEKSIETLQKVCKKLEVIQRGSLETRHSGKAFKLVARSEQQGRMLRQTFYFFGQGERKYVATCSALADGGEKLDDRFESSMKTFRLH